MDTQAISVLADQSVLGLDEVLAPYANIKLEQVAVRDIPEKLYANTYEALFCRSTLKINAKLFAKTKKTPAFVASCVTGIDHIDFDSFKHQACEPYIYCAQGCNAEAVLSYVQQVLSSLQKRKYLGTDTFKACVIGLGRIGKLIARHLKCCLGARVYYCDPFVQSGEFTPITFEDIQDMDFISVHTPLTSGGKYPTWQMLNKDFFHNQKAGCVLLNAGRGEVMVEADACEAKHLNFCLDVWPNEPVISPTLLQRAVMATPHIAGHTLYGLFNGTWMAYQAFCNHFALPVLSAFPKRYIFNKHADLMLFSQEFKATLLTSVAPSETFQKIRKQYALSLSI